VTARLHSMRLPIGTVVVAVSAVLGCAAQPTPRNAVDARSVELGTSTTELVAMLGAPSRVADTTKGDRTFRTFYYPNDLSCVVDLTADVVCKVSVGETDGYCYPLR
jgi:ABC-type hemin transport system substrate-binding protein